jgi:hypothetical protein
VPELLQWKSREMANDDDNVSQANGTTATVQQVDVATSIDAKMLKQTCTNPDPDTEIRVPELLQ